MKFEAASDGKVVSPVARPLLIQLCEEEALLDLSVDFGCYLIAFACHLEEHLQVRPWKGRAIILAVLIALRA